MITLELSYSCHICIENFFSTLSFPWLTKNIINLILLLSMQLFSLIILKLSLKSKMSEWHVQVDDQKLWRKEIISTKEGK